MLFRSRNFSSTGVKQVSSLGMRVVATPMVSAPPWRSSFKLCLEAVGVGGAQIPVAHSEEVQAAGLGVGREGFGLWIWLEGRGRAWVQTGVGSCLSGSLTKLFCGGNRRWAPGEEEQEVLEGEASLLGMKL